MSRKIERVFRDRKLTAEEIARDEQVRRQVEREFPPAPRSISSGPVTDMLRHALQASAKPVAQIAAEAGVSQRVVLHFLAGQSDIHMATADRLAEALGLKLAAES